ncbi:MAG TPA: uracil-DNA glycosylase [Chloroflexi bacterium]|nr:uracil-DNA glycosylase [Chloroflexota bacterium]
MSPEEILQQIQAEVQVCTRCELHHSRKHGVSGAGPAHAEIMFIGEGPGFHENETGIPFVGGSGKFLDELLMEIGLNRDEIFVGNVIKCRPPGNRDPQTAELAACDPYLERQIAAINPRVIVTLGRFSMAKFLPNAKISEVHGQAMNVRGRLVVPMYHPAAALHQRSLQPILKADFAKLPELIAQAASAPEYMDDTPEDKEEPKQLSMF